MLQMSIAGHTRSLLTGLYLRVKEHLMPRNSKAQLSTAGGCSGRCHWPKMRGLFLDGWTMNSRDRLDIEVTLSCSICLMLESKRE